MDIKLHETIIVEENRQDSLSRYTDRRIPNKLGQSLDDTDNGLLKQLYDISLEYVIYSILLQDFKLQELMAAIQLLIQSDALQYLSMFNQSKPEFSFLGNKKLKVHESDYLSSDGHSLPIRLFYWGVICQSSKIKNILLNNDYGAFLTGKGWDADYLRAHYNFVLLILENKWDEADEYYETLYTAYEELAPVNKMHPRFYLPLWEALLSGDEARFNEKLPLCIEDFKSYWSDTSDSDPDINNDIDGHFSLEITALIKIAVLKGYKITTTSDYTPSFFTDKDFKLDLDTELEWYFTPKEIDFGAGLDLEALLKENQKGKG